MHYSKIKWVDVANGTGVRISLFVSGCPHHCVGCFNPETWDFQAGDPYTEEIEATLLDKLNASHIKGLSLLGGEPLAPSNQATVLSLVTKAKTFHPEKDIWCYTGYTFEPLYQGEVGDYALPLLEKMDYLVDGLFLASEKNPSLAFRGSSNQRILHLPSSLKERTAVVIPDKEFRSI